MSDRCAIAFYANFRNICELDGKLQEKEANPISRRPHSRHWRWRSRSAIGFVDETRGRRNLGTAIERLAALVTPVGEDGQAPSVAGALVSRVRGRETK